MSDIQAAIGVIQLEKLEKVIERRRKLAEIYHKIMNDLLPHVKPFKERDGSRSTYQSYVVRLPNEFGKYQQAIIAHMREKYSIEVQIGTYALHLEPAFRRFVGNSTLKISEALRSTTLTLPLYESLEEEDIEYIVHALASIYKVFSS